VVAAVPTLDTLRRQLQASAPRSLEARGGARLRTGDEGLDQLLEGGLPRGAWTVLGGAPGAGRLTLAAGALALETRGGRPVAWIDAGLAVYPPALAERGVDLTRLLMVRGAGERAAPALEQLVASGCFGAVVATGLDRLLGPAAMRRLQLAAEGTSTAAVLALEPASAAQAHLAALRLGLERRGGGVRVEVEKDRSGRAVGRATLLEGGARAVLRPVA
jgi:protein ImuA